MPVSVCDESDIFLEKQVSPAETPVWTKYLSVSRETETVASGM